MLEVPASGLSSEDDKEMKSYMDQMDDELARTSIGESFEKVNMTNQSELEVRACSQWKAREKLRTPALDWL